MITQFFRNANNIAGFNVANGDPGITADRPDRHRSFGAAGVHPNAEPLRAPTAYVIFCGFLVAICIFVSLRIREGRLGRAWLAIREDELAASMMGVPLVRTKLSRTRSARSSAASAASRMPSHDHTACSPSGFDFGKSVTGAR